MIPSPVPWESIREEGAVLPVDKPMDWTSYQVVRKIRSLFNVRRVGHAGTLDPKATGLLVVCTGAKTKQVPSLMSMEKEYVGAMELGIRTPSFDLETPVSERRSFDHVTSELIVQATAALVGEILQRPPMYSALKFEGRPLYRYARKGEEIERPARIVVVKEFTVLSVDLPRVEFRVVCSKGTYIRSLVDDVGQRLGCGATLVALRRTRIGALSVDAAWTMDRLADVSREFKLAKQKAS